MHGQNRVSCAGRTVGIARLLKVVIVVLLSGVVASLFSGLNFLFKDTNQPQARRTLRALGVRVALAAALLATIGYGLATGQLRLGASAPWHGATSAPALEDIDEHE